MKTRTFFLIFGFLSLLAFEISAQEFKYGLQVGTGISNVKTQNNSYFGITIIPSERKIAYSANAYIAFRSKGFWGISVEPGFIQKGYHLSKSSTGFESADINFNYIQLPLLADFYIGKYFGISAGTEFSYLVDAVAKTGSTSTSINNNYLDFEISGLIGIQVKVSQHMNTGIRYSHGLKPVFKINFTDANGQPFSDDIKSYNHYIQVFFRYVI